MNEDRYNNLRSFADECVARMESLTSQDELTEDEAAEFDQCAEWTESARTEIDTYQERQARIDAAAEVATRDDVQFERGIPESINVNTRTDPFDGLESLERASSGDLKARALDVIEDHVPSEVPSEFRKGATERAEQRKTGKYDADLVNRHIIESSSPAYIEAFEQYLRSGGRQVSDVLMGRAAMSLTAGNGGVMVPQFLDPTIVLTNDGTINQIRQIASQVSITTDQWDGVTSAGVTAEWLTEGSEAADATPTYVGPTITPHKASAYAFASYEILMDSGFDEIGTLFADAFDRLEATGFTTGNGSGQPYGVVTQLSGTGPVVAGSSGAAGAADLVAADIYALDSNLGARWRGGASFLSAKANYNDIRQLGTSDSAHSFWIDFGGGLPATLIGYNTYQAEDMDSTIVSGSDDYPIILGDFNAGYKIVDRIGTTLVYEPHVIGSNQRSTGQAAWFAYKRVGGDILTSNAFKTLKL